MTCRTPKCSVRLEVAAALKQSYGLKACDNLRIFFKHFAGYIVGHAVTFTAHGDFLGASPMTFNSIQSNHDFARCGGGRMFRTWPMTSLATDPGSQVVNFCANNFSCCNMAIHTTMHFVSVNNISKIRHAQVGLGLCLSGRNSRVFAISKPRHAVFNSYGFCATLQECKKRDRMLSGSDGKIEREESA